MMQPAIRTAVAFVLALLFALPATASADEEAARQKLESARELYASGNWETAKEAYEEAYATAPDDSIARAEATLEWANLLWEQGIYDAAYKRAKEALERAKKLKLEAAIGRLLLTLGHIEASRGDLAGAETTLELCADLAAEQKDTNFQALCRMNTRFVRKLRGKNPGSEAQFKRDLATLEKSGEPLFVGTALAKTAELQARTGDPLGGLAFLKRAHAQFEKAGSLPAITRNRMRLAQAYQQLGKWNDAARELDGLVLTYQNMRNRPGLVTAYTLEGRQAEHTGDAGKALENYRRAIATAKKLGSPQITANAYLAECEFFGRTDSPQKGSTACAASRKLFQKVGMPTLSSRALVVQARAAHARNDLESARKLYLQVIDELDDRKAGRDHQVDLATQRVNLCQVERALGYAGALKLCRDAAEALEELSDKTPQERAMERMTLYNVGAEAHKVGNTKEAIENLEAAAERFVTAGQRVEAANALTLLGATYKQTNSTTKMKAAWERGLQLLAGTGDAGASASVELRTQLGQSYLDDGQWDDAVSTLEPLVEDAAEIENWDRAAWAALGAARAQLKLGRRDQAIATLKSGKAHARKADDADLRKLINANLDKLEK